MKRGYEVTILYNDQRIRAGFVVYKDAVRNRTGWSFIPTFFGATGTRTPKPTKEEVVKPIIRRYFGKKAVDSIRYEQSGVLHHIKDNPMRNPTYKDMLRIARKRIKAKDYMGAHEAITASGANMQDIKEFFTSAEMKAMARWANQRVGATPKKRKKNPLGWQSMTKADAMREAKTHAQLTGQPAAVGKKGRQYTVMPGIGEGTKTAFGWTVVKVFERTKRNPKVRRNSYYRSQSGFRKISPRIEEETYEEQRAAGRYNPGHVFIYKNNRYYTGMGTTDDLTFWKSGNDIWLLIRNHRHGYVGLYLYEIERYKQDEAIQPEREIFMQSLDELADMAPGDPYDWSDAKMRDVLSEWI